MVSTMSRCPTKSCQRIISEALPTNRATRERPACKAQARTATRFLSFESTSTSSTQGRRLSFKSPGKFKQSDQVWFESKPLGVNQLSTNMTQISIGSGLSKKYTNHCVRATARFTLWSDLCVPAQHIRSISAHAIEQSLASNNRRASTSQLKNCSDILSYALQKGRAQAQTAIAVLPSRTHRVPQSHQHSWLKFLRILPQL